MSGALTATFMTKKIDVASGTYLFNRTLLSENKIAAHRRCGLATPNINHLHRPKSTSNPSSYSDELISDLSHVDYVDFMNYVDYVDPH